MDWQWFLSGMGVAVALFLGGLLFKWWLVLIAPLFVWVALRQKFRCAWCKRRSIVRLGTRLHQCGRCGQQHAIRWEAR